MTCPFATQRRRATALTFLRDNAKLRSRQDVVVNGTHRYVEEGRKRGNVVVLVQPKGP